MGLRFRKTIKIVPGVKLNISKSGISTSVGKPGATLNFSKRGTRATVGIPGSGISYSQKIGGKSVRQTSSKRSLEDIRKDMMQQYGLTRSEIKRFEKKFRKNPKKYRNMSENELVAQIKKGRLPSRMKRIIYVIVFILLIILIAGGGKSKKDKSTSSQKINTTGTKVAESTNKKTEEAGQVTAQQVKNETTTQTEEDSISVSEVGAETEKQDYIDEFEDIPYMKGRGLVDIVGMEPNYVGAKGFAAISAGESLEENQDYSSIPWNIPIYEKNSDGWKECGIISHKTRIGILSQELAKKNGKEYQGYLEFVDFNSEITGYINVKNFVTIAYWDEDLNDAVEKGYGIAEYKQKSKYAPILQNGSKANLNANDKVLLLEKGTYFVSVADKVNYSLVGVVYIERNGKSEKQYIFFNKDDLTLIY